MSTKGDDYRGILLESGTNEVEFLEFTIRGEHFAMNVAKVSQLLVLENLTITKLPGSQAAVVGTVYYRGVPITVVNLAEALELMEDKGPAEKQLLLVAEFNGKHTGFIVDTVEVIRRMSWEDFAPLETKISDVDGEGSVVGTITVDEQIVMVLDVEAIMADVDPTLDIAGYSGDLEADSSIDKTEFKIIYAEDSPIVQKVGTKALLDAGFENLKVFSTGAQAFRYVMENGPDCVDLILSDIEMPEMDGLTFCKEVKTNEQLAEIPFVFFSSLINEQMEAKCKSVGGDACLSKPDIRRIIEVISRFCA